MALEGSGPSSPRADRGASSFVQWTGLYVSGVLLLVFVGAHLWSVHYASEMAPSRFTFDAVAANLQNPLYAFVDLSLLVLALFHGLLGTHRVVADLGLCGPRALRVVGFVLAVAGVVGLWYGWIIYAAFVG